jgi:hypothetical protein
MCQQVIEWGKLGKSRAWIASELDIAKSTLQLWEAEHPDFSAAITRSQTYAQRWWEDKGQEALDTREFQANVWSRSMAARFPDDWREKVGHVGGNKDDEPIKTETTHVGLDEFARRIASISARTAADSGNEPPDGATAG